MNEEKILTEEMSKWFVENKGKSCPFCKSQHLKHSLPLDSYGIYVEIETECRNCRESWVSVYKLIAAEQPQEI